MRLHRVVALITLCLGNSPTARGQLPFEQKPIEYSASAPRDPVGLLSGELQRGLSGLRTEQAGGLLRLLLEQLQIPVSSQTLVFSKTSLQKHLISPANPRAIYFNDNVYVAWVPNGEFIEIASIDPLLGSVFYTINQRDGRDVGKLVRKKERCLFCHASSDTGRVPGLLMGSVYTDAIGNRLFPANAIPTDADGPIQGRWGGWFVTGRHGTQTHLGNRTIDPGQEVSKSTINGNVTDLSPWFDVAKYPAPHSDIVALLVLRHQVTMHNLLIQANHRVRLQLSGQTSQSGDAALLETSKVIDEAAGQLVDGLLMVHDAVFNDPIVGTSNFAEEFACRGPRDAAGRSVRQLDLVDRLFRYRCSFLIYSASFDALPTPLLDRTYELMWSVLNSQTASGRYAHLSLAERAAILQILRETKHNLPATWQKN